MLDFLTFRRMITPIIIQVLFWIGVVVVIGAGCIAIAASLAGIRAPGTGQETSGGAIIGGIALILFGPIVLRIYAEVLMVLFRINETLTDVCNRLVSIDQKTKSQP